MRNFFSQMYRKLPSWNKVKNNGIPEIIIGSSILLYVSYDYYRNKNLEDTRLNMIQTIDDEQRRLYKSMKIESNMFYKNKQELYSCELIHPLHLSFDGYKCLSNVEVGDIVLVFEEKVGPNNMYHFCKFNNEYGLIPMVNLRNV